MDTITTGIEASALFTTTTTDLMELGLSLDPQQEGLYVALLLLGLALRGLHHVATGSPFDGQEQEEVDSENKE